MRKILFFLSLFFLFSCSLRRNVLFWKKKGVCVKRVVVIGFRPVSPVFKGSSFVRCPIRGETYRGERVKEEIAERLTEILIAGILEKRLFEIIRPEKVREEFLDLKKTIDSAKGSLLIDYLRQIGITFRADAVLIGHIFRWEERKGSSFFSSSPASVAFDLHMIDVESGKEIFYSKFDKTQVALTENILEIETFIRGKGRWMKAEELARIGIRKMIKKLSKR